MIQDGNPANAAYTNTKFVSRTNDTSTVGKLSLENTDPDSGATVSNTQQAVNETFDAVGITGVGDTNRKVYSSNNFIADGDSHKVAIGKIDTQLDLTQTQLDALDLINSEDITLGAVGSSPNANSATLTGQVLNLEPASASFPGLVTTGTQTFAGNKTFQNNVIVTGDLTVNGLTTTVNSTTVEVADPTMLLNNGGNDASSEGAGIHIERTTTNASIVFEDALASKWKAGLLGSESELLTAGATQVVTGNKDFQGDIKTDAIAESTLDEGVTVDGVLIKDGQVDGVDVSTLSSNFSTHTGDTTIHFTQGTIDHTAILNIGTNSHATIDSHLASTSNPHSVTATQVGLSNVTNDAQLKRAAADFNSFTEKTTPVDDDIVLIEDSADSYNKKKLKLANMIGGGSGSGAKNYFPNDIYQGASALGWTTYKNTTPGAIPEATPGGTPSGNITLSTSASSPLSGDSSLVLTKIGSVSTIGEGVYYDFTLDISDRGKALAFIMNYAIASGTYADGDVTIWFADKTNNVIYQPTPYKLLNHSLSSERFFSEIQTTVVSAWRIYIHFSSTSAVNYSLKLDDLLFGPQAKLYGSVTTDWASYTPTLTNITLGTGGYSDAKWRRVGDTVEVQASLTLGTGGAFTGSPIISMPFTPDHDKLTNVVDVSTGYPLIGEALGWDNSAAQIYTALIEFLGKTSNIHIMSNGATPWNATAPITWAVSDQLIIKVRYPAVGFSSSQLLSSDASTRVVAMQATGTSSAVTSGNPVIYPTKTFDTHSGYDTGTGRYLTKESGYYDIKLVASGSAVTYYVYLDAVQDVVIALPVASGYSTGAVTVYAKANQYIDVRPNGSTTPSGSLSISKINGPSQIAASEKIKLKYIDSSGASIGTSPAVFKYATKVYDSHNCYSTSTGLFTAPRSDVYIITAKVLTATVTLSTTQTLLMAVMKNGGYEEITAVLGNGASNNYYAEINSHVSLLQGETMEVQISAGVATTALNNSVYNVISIASVGGV